MLEYSLVLLQVGEGNGKIINDLYQAGRAVSMANPARTKHYGDNELHRNKTD